MESLPFGSLWLPVVVSAIVVWIASAIVWMALPHHHGDFRPLPDQEGVRAALGKAIPPGHYVLPYWEEASKEKRAEIDRLAQEGPVGILTIGRPGKIQMGGRLVQSLIHYFVVSFIVAYVARHTLTPAADPLHVFRITGTVGVVSYTMALFPDAIWFWRPWNVTLKHAADGIAYGLLTGATFALLWRVVLS